LARGGTRLRARQHARHAVQAERGDSGGRELRRERGVLRGSEQRDSHAAALEQRRFVGRERPQLGDDVGAEGLGARDEARAGCGVGVIRQLGANPQTALADDAEARLN